MTRTEIARRLHDMVDEWHSGALATLAEETGGHMLMRLTFTDRDNPADTITLVVGTELGGDDDD